MAPHVSIVTPAYNEVSHIGECAESVLAQSWDDWDWTIVDNMSTDGTGEAIAAIADGDERIRVVRNDRFLNVSENHNEALRRISPSAVYCKVVAADDVLRPDCVLKLVEVAEAHPRVVIVGSLAQEGDGVRFQGLPPSRVTVSGVEICRAHLMGGPYVFGVPTSVLYRAEIVRSRHTFYNEQNIHSDSEVCYEFLRDADFGFVHEVLSDLRVRDASETAYSQRLNTYRYGALQALVTYGRDYLTDAEWESLLARELGVYRRFLGKNLLKLRGAEFWEYHLPKLEELGYPMSRTDIVRGSFELVAGRLGSGLAGMLRTLSPRRQE